MSPTQSVTLTLLCMLTLVWLTLGDYDFISSYGLMLDLQYGDQHLPRPYGLGYAWLPAV
jgi:hypothetical protein